MQKTIGFALNKFPSTPHLLRTDPSIDSPDTEFVLDLSRLYHHYHTDFWGVKPFDPDHTQFEYLRFLASCNDFRFLGSHPSTSEAQKRTVSHLLGQAFCRYFLYEFCGVTFFAHMDKVLGKTTHPAFNGLKIERIVKGDVPDYLCAKSATKPYIGEAKGRFNGINFTSAEFNDWRNQFKRIRVLDKLGITKRLKGYIVATKFTNELNRASNKTKLFAEDPETEGELDLTDNDVGLGRGCTSLHYARLVSKLGLNLLAQSLDEGFVVPRDLSYNLPIWRCNYPPLKGETFVGGFMSDAQPTFQKKEDGTVYFQPNVLQLGMPSASFYGLKVDTFRTLRDVCLGNWNLLDTVPQLEDTDYRPSNLAWLRDGSITGTLEFFELVGTATF